MLCRRRGFSLIEVLIVIIVVGILVGILFVSSNNTTDKAEATKIVNNLRVLKSACLLYYADHGKWPVDLGDQKGKVINKINDLKKYLPITVDDRYLLTCCDGKGTSVSDGNPPEWKGTVFIKFQDKKMTEGVAKQLALMAPTANLWNSSQWSSTYTDDRYQYYNGKNYGKTGTQRQSIHYPVYITATNYR